MCSLRYVWGSFRPPPSVHISHLPPWSAHQPLSRLASPLLTPLAPESLTSLFTCSTSTLATSRKHSYPILFLRATWPIPLPFGPWGHPTPVLQACCMPYPGAAVTAVKVAALPTPCAQLSVPVPRLRHCSAPFFRLRIPTSLPLAMPDRPPLWISASRLWGPASGTVHPLQVPCSQLRCPRGLSHSQGSTNSRCTTDSSLSHASPFQHRQLCSHYRCP